MTTNLYTIDIGKVLVIPKEIEFWNYSYECGWMHSDEIPFRPNWNGRLPYFCYWTNFNLESLFETPSSRKMVISYEELNSLIVPNIAACVLIDEDGLLEYIEGYHSIKKYCFKGEQK